MTNFRSITSGAAAALAASALFAGPASATQGQGVTVALIVNGHFGELDVNASQKTGKWDMLLKTKADTDVGSDSITFVGGGFSGWHSHPAAVFVTVTQGTIVWFNGTNPLCPSQTFTVGQSFVEDAFVVHNSTNGSATEQAQYIAVRINPTGVPFRVDQPKPNNCNF
jgi:quercetin dioxygenase-like cupin family protein